ncbi:hypothetical protein Cylst_5282 [Cylindrospermum stagnale PCC 7417]|uniref:Uncharacterized protein n=1 Tax=Cylindrospermum stagnale PCC 7417 TaxID=56107 RepID=K9X5D8_9NOST|nr:hypothetical protein Cylst_5282 [Cylindrospermum stagnale PCC 7417]
MTTVAILPISNASGEKSYRAIAGDKQSVASNRPTTMDSFRVISVDHICL